MRRKPYNPLVRCKLPSCFCLFISRLLLPVGAKTPSTRGIREHVSDTGASYKVVGQIERVYN